MTIPFSFSSLTSELAGSGDDGVATARDVASSRISGIFRTSFLINMVQLCMMQLLWVSNLGDRFIVNCYM